MRLLRRSKQACRRQSIRLPDRINLKSAKALALNVLATLLGRADEVPAPGHEVFLLTASVAMQHSLD